MADDENYDILPHQLLSDLKFDVEALKKKLSEPDSKSQELILEIESLKDAVHELTVIFHKALEQTKGDADFQQMLKTVSDRLNQIADQNETIAKGMVAIADKVDSMGVPSQSPMMPKTQMQAPIQHTMGMPPSMVGPARVAPKSGFGSMPPSSASSFPVPPSMSAMDLPPPPPRMTAKRGGLFQ